MSDIAISVIIPIYNEEENIALLCDKVFTVLKKIGKKFEVIFINDGSKDSSLEKLREQQKIFQEIKIINFKRNYGQTAATQAGIDSSKGEIIISLDGDMQNDPEDIPNLLDKINQGYDVVSGWRKDRRDSAIKRNFVSRVANKIISYISGVKLNDYGCTLKAYRREIIKDVKLYGEMHRFIPIYASWLGAKVTEMEVRHHPRIFGTSKYGLERIFKVILDLIVIKFIDKYLVKPIYIFGGFGFISIILSFITFAVMLYLRLFMDKHFISTPLPLLTVMFFLVGIMSILMGLLAEIMVRTYFESQQRKPYLVKDYINFDEINH
jgi:glycosyltransferase involved in cell wall biosynthesis